MTSLQLSSNNVCYMLSGHSYYTLCRAISPLTTRYQECNSEKVNTIQNRFTGMCNSMLRVYIPCIQPYSWEYSGALHSSTSVYECDAYFFIPRPEKCMSWMLQYELCGENAPPSRSLNSYGRFFWEHFATTNERSLESPVMQAEHNVGFRQWCVVQIRVEHISSRFHWWRLNHLGGRPWHGLDILPLQVEEHFLGDAT